MLTSVLSILGDRVRQTGDLLDVGCGGGWLLAELAAVEVPEERLHGVDLLPIRVDAARRRLPRAEVLEADACDLPFADGRFAAATLLTTLSSMPAESIPSALAETRRVLAPEGIVLVYEPWLPNPFNRATVTVRASWLESALGLPFASISLTAFPPITRRLGRAAPRLYPRLTRIAPTHRLTAYEPGALR